MAPSAPTRASEDFGSWHVFTGDAATVPFGAAVLLPIEEWRSAPWLWARHAGRIGLLLGPTDATELIVSVLDGVDALAPCGMDPVARVRLRAALEARGWRGAWLDAGLRDGSSPGPRAGDRSTETARDDASVLRRTIAAPVDAGATAIGCAADADGPWTSPA